MCQEKPDIKYPTKWQYKVFVEDTNSLDSVLFEAFNEEYTKKMGKKSSNGKYTSFDVETLVKSEEERNIIFSKLKSNKMVKFVI